MPPKPKPTTTPPDAQAEPFDDLSGARAGGGLVEAEVDAAVIEAALSDPRSVEWSQPWMGAFIEALALIPNVTASAKKAHITRQAAHYARKRDALFAACWDAAVEESIDNLEQFAHSMSTTGLETVETRTTTKKALMTVKGQTEAQWVPVEETTVTVRSRLVSPQMAMFLLSAHRPDKFRRPQRFEHTGANGDPIQVTEKEREAAVGAFDSAVVRLADRRRARDSAAGSGAG